MDRKSDMEHTLIADRMGSGEGGNCEGRLFRSGSPKDSKFEKDAIRYGLCNPILIGGIKLYPLCASAPQCERDCTIAPYPFLVGQALFNPEASIDSEWCFQQWDPPNLNSPCSILDFAALMYTTLQI
jgi:hypothetical protein